ncbi:hypothetical protein Bca4012_053498 [Brassica carinata]
MLRTAMHERLPTGERMRNWNGNADVACVLCQEPLEIMDHLFFECSYSTQIIWENLMKGGIGTSVHEELETHNQRLTRRVSSSFSLSSIYSNQQLIPFGEKGIRNLKVE